MYDYIYLYCTIIYNRILKKIDNLKILLKREVINHTSRILDIHSYNAHQIISFYIGNRDTYIKPNLNVNINHIDYRLLGLIDYKEFDFQDVLILNHYSKLDFSYYDNILVISGRYIRISEKLIQVQQILTRSRGDYLIDDDIIENRLFIEKLLEEREHLTILHDYYFGAIYLGLEDATNLGFGK